MTTQHHQPLKLMTHDEAQALFGQHFDAQCGRCGSSMGHIDCESCGGDGTIYDEDDEGIHRYLTCDTCEGDGSWLVCISSYEWCQANPLEGREQVERSTTDWFPTGGPDV